MVYSKSGELRFDDLCMEGSKNSVVKLQKCSEGNQKQIWHYDKDVNLTFNLILNQRIFLFKIKQIKHTYSDQCMGVDQSKDNGKIILGKLEIEKQTSKYIS